MIKLGEKYRDKVTGIEGVVTAKSEYLYGATRYCIEPKPDGNGTPVEVQWVEEDRMEKAGE